LELWNHHGTLFERSEEDSIMLFITFKLKNTDTYVWPESDGEIPRGPKIFKNDSDTS
jgi:hypothetical protein